MLENKSIKNATDETILLTVGLRDNSEPDHVIELKSKEEREIICAYDRIVINKA